MRILRYMELGGAVLAMLLLAGLVGSWRAARQEQAQLQAELKVTQQALQEANQRQKDRDVVLSRQLDKLSKQKASVNSPTQVLSALPDLLPLPVPLAVVQDASPGAQGEGTLGSKNSLPIVAPQPKVTLPVEDLKPLYDYAVECKACQLKLAASEADLKDERVKTVALGRERDNALREARGGSALRRIVRAAKWFAIGAAAGAVAAKLSR